MGRKLQSLRKRSFVWISCLRSKRNWRALTRNRRKRNGSTARNRFSRLFGHGQRYTLPENCQSRSSIQLSSMPWTTGRSSSTILRMGTVPSAIPLRRTVSAPLWLAGRTGCLPEVRRVLRQVQESTRWSRQRKPMGWMQWNISNISCQICRGVYFLKIRNIWMTICHGITWYRNGADDHCPFSIEG